MRRKAVVRTTLIALGVIGLVIFYFLLPSPLFNDPYCMVLNDEKGQLLSASIADDGQWRFPGVDSIPDEMKECLLHFEDEYFYYHPGVNPVSILRALSQNITAGRVVSGGSTISMQVIRISQKNRERTYGRKLIEMIKAIRLELGHSKDEILEFYLTHAPYGGNVVGAETAAWRYFNRPLTELSWAEYATLAVLPNAPSLIMPGRNADKLKSKRDRLLRKLLENKKIDSLTYSLAISETLPGKPHPLPFHAHHLLRHFKSLCSNGCRVRSTLDGKLQRRLESRLNNYTERLAESKIRNACGMVIDLKTAEVKAYIGNANYKNVPAKFVDLIRARRSSGSILKPFLYAGTIEEGLIHTSTLLRDVPTRIYGFAPTNFNDDYEGMVRADLALPRSLNIPATLLLRDFGVISFHQQLKRLGFTTIDRSPQNYGLSLILGGAEVTLWDVASIYGDQARNLNSFTAGNNEIKSGIKLQKEDQLTGEKEHYSAGSWWLVSQALKEVQRPGIEESWRRFSSSRDIAWKTGTSFGFRDAWAVGYNAEYLVAVWVGNATGEGRPGLTGASVAAPLMFDFFQNISGQSWFEKPIMDLKYVTLCAESGLAPNPYCPRREVEAPMSSSMPLLCHYHVPVTLNESGERVFRECYEGNVTDTSWFILDPIAGYYYHQKHNWYSKVPQYSEKCAQEDPTSIAILYPSNRSEVIIPKDFDRQYEKVLAEAVHNDPEATLFWHLDEEYIGTTTNKHKLPLELSPGKHSLTVLDLNGSKANVRFEAH